MHAVELEQLRVHVGRAEIVDRDEIEIVAASFQERPERQPADAAKSVNGNALVSHVLPTSYLILTISPRAAAATASGVIPKCLYSSLSRAPKPRIRACR